MTKVEHITYWRKQVDEDFDCANVLYQTNHFAQSLFCEEYLTETKKMIICLQEKLQ